MWKRVHSQHLVSAHESVDAFVAAMKATHPVNLPRHGECASTTKERQPGAFFKTWDIEEAYRLALNGWPEGRSRIKTAMGLAKAEQAPMPTVATRHDVAGDQPDVARYVSGIPDCMIVEETAPERRAPVLRLRLCIGALSIIPGGILEMRGAAVLAQIDAWEQIGTQVEVIAASDSRVKLDSKGQILSTEVLVKRAGEPLELDRLAFVFNHAGFFRRLMLASRDRVDASQMNRENYGKTYDLRRMPYLLQPYRADGPMVYLPGITPQEIENYSSPAKASARIAQQFAEAITADDMHGTDESDDIDNDD